MSRRVRSVFLAAMLLASVVAGAVAMPVAAQTETTDAAGTANTTSSTDTTTDTDQPGVFDRINIFVNTVVNVVTGSAQAQESPESTDDENSSDEQSQTRTDVMINVSGEVEAGNNVTVTVTRNGTPVDGATISVDGEPVGETDADGELVVTLPSDDAELSAEFETETMVLVQHEVIGGPDQDHSVDINQSRAVEIAKSDLSADVNWTVERVDLVDGAGYFDVRLDGADGEQAKVRVDGSSEVVFFLQEKHPIEDDEHDTHVSVTGYTVSNTTVAVDETVTVTATVENTGDANGTATVTLLADNETVQTRNVSVGANATETVTLGTSFDEAGQHTVGVNDLEPTNITVEARSEPPTNETGSLAGTVTDAATGDAIANATVHVAETNASATTGPNGTYTIDAVPAGTHDVTAQAEGYDSLTQAVTITANETTTQDFVLNATAEVPNQTAVTFDDQTATNGSVAVTSVSLADGGFVVIHNESGDVIGHSAFLEVGTHEDVSVPLDKPLGGEQTLTAMAHRDTNGNQTFDFVTSAGSVDTPYTVDNETVADTANVSVEQEPAPTANRVDVVLDGAPNGLQTYSVTVTVSEGSNATIDGVEAQLIPSGRLQVVERTNSSITFRAADLGDAVGPFNDSRALATVNLTGTASAEQVGLTVNQLTDDTGSAMNTSRVRLALEGELFAEPLPGSGGTAPPTDPDGDGLYEDVDGDGTAAFDDAISLAFVDFGTLSTEQQSALDFNGDGSATFADAIELAFQV